ncbi:NUDIX hydrolase [Sphingobium sp. TomTYG45]
MIVPKTIRIAAALIDDTDGRLLLVRKSGTEWFMQAGGKIEGGETAVEALIRELQEEISLTVNSGEVKYLGRFSAPAANEIQSVVDAEVFHIRTFHKPEISSEIAEAVWLHAAQADSIPLAPLTRDYILPLARSLSR